MGQAPRCPTVWGWLAAASITSLTRHLTCKVPWVAPPIPQQSPAFPHPCLHLRKSSTTWRGIYKCHLTGLWGEHRDWGVPERPEAHSQAGTNPHQSTSNQGLGTQSLLRDQGIHL